MALNRGNGKASAVKNIVVVSDLHCGCRLGLCPPGEVHLDDGGTYKPSTLQRKVWNMWRIFWRDWVPMATHGEPFCVVVNGDAVEGCGHHGVTTTISNNAMDQESIAYQVLKPIVEQCDGRLYMVRGTPAHVGQSGVDEERLARKLGTIPNKEGQHSRWELNKSIGRYVCNFNHHIGTTSSSAHETSAINAELAAAFVEAGRWSHKPPAVVVRSHRHRCAEVRIPAKWGYAISFVTPAWQLKTPFSYKVAGGRMTMPQIGGSLIRLGDEELHTRHKVWDIERDDPE